MASLFDLGIFSVLTTSGAIDPGATLTWYEAGTTTPTVTYSDPDLTVPNSNPVVADANGRFPQIWLQSGSYKYVLKSSAGVTLKTVDDYSTVFSSVALSASSTIDDADGNPHPIGYRGIPTVSATGATVLSATHAGTKIKITVGGVTVPTNASVPLDTDFACQVYNHSASSQTIIQAGGVTLRLAGTATTGDRTLAQRGLATIEKLDTDEWVIGGQGVT